MICYTAASGEQEYKNTQRVEWCVNRGSSKIHPYATLFF